MPVAGSRRVLRSADRARTAADGLDSRHSFSFGDHYDPENTHHGVLLAVNDDVVAPGAGFDTHPHRDIEVITWVVDGTMVHVDSDGHSGLLYPGLVARMSAGAGTTHSERNDPWPELPGSGTRPARVVASWVMPDRTGGEPDYQQRDVTSLLAAGGLVLVASGDPHQCAPLSIGNRDASLYVARLAPAEVISLPTARFVHLFVVAGEVGVGDSTMLATGDAVRLTENAEATVTASTAAEVLVWQMHRGLTDPPVDT